jgi:hypothetical protein
MRYKFLVVGSGVHFGQAGHEKTPKISQGSFREKLNFNASSRAESGLSGF